MSRLTGACLFLGMALTTNLTCGHDGPHQHSHTQSVATMPTNKVKISIQDGYRYIFANGLPDHQTGMFPNRFNPNRIQPQRYAFRVPMEPQRARTTTPVRHQLFGVGLNGVPFDPGTAEYWRRDPRSGWNFEALSGKINLGLDANNAHVQPHGAYHYHGIPTGLLTSLQKGQQKQSNQMTLVGYAADGFPVYGPLAHSTPDDATSDLKTMKSSYRLKRGNRPSGPGGAYDGTFVQDWEYVEGAGDLDECNGRFGVTPDYPEGTYYYVLTEDFPFIPREFRGTPDPSFRHHGPPPGGRRPPRGGQPPFGQGRSTGNGSPRS